VCKCASCAGKCAGTYPHAHKSPYFHAIRWNYAEKRGTLPYIARNLPSLGLFWVEKALSLCAWANRLSLKTTKGRLDRGIAVVDTYAGAHVRAHESLGFWATEKRSPYACVRS